MKIQNILLMRRVAVFCIFMFLITMLFSPMYVSKNETEKDASDIVWWFDLDAPSFGSAATDDIDDDGLLEIVFGTYFNDEHIYALNAEDGSLLWDYDTGGCNDASPVIFDVDLDGELEVIIPSSSPYEVYCFNGATGDVEWSTSTGYPNCIDSPPAIADLDNDEKPEIVLGTFYGYVFCLNGEDGSIEWQINLGTDSYIQSGPNILDLNSDGQLDVVVAQYSGDCNVYALYGNNGSTMWYSDLPADYMYHGGSFADIDEDGLPEIVIGCYDNYVYVFNGEDGSLHWDYEAPNYIASPTAIADLDNDDHLEIVFTSYNYLGVLSYTGDLLWSYTTGGSMFRGASISDTNGDGILDVIFGADDGILRVVHGINGSLIWDVDLEDHYADTFQIDHAPIIEDFDDDGLLDIFIIGGYGTSSPSENNHGRAYVLHAGEGTGPGWPMFRHDIHHSACFHYQQEEFDIYVDDDAEPGWYDGTHVKTISEGIFNASSGDTIFVYNGLYIENVEIDKSIELIGEDTYNTIIDGGNNSHVVNILSDSVLVSNFTIQNSGDNFWQDKGVRIQADYCIFKNCIVINNSGALLVYDSIECVIINNDFISNDHDVVFNEVNFSYLNNNIISNCRAVHLYDSNDNIVFQNHIFNNSDGFYFDSSNRNSIYENNISNNGKEPYAGAGIYVEGSSTGNEFLLNKICNNRNEGMSINLGSHNNSIIQNLIANNNRGIFLGTGLTNNSIYHNTFVNNTEYNARDIGINIWDDGYPSGGNYWDDYTGTDGDDDGIGDTPYYILGGSNMDNYPLMEPFGQLDCNQSEFDRGFPIRHAADGDWAAAQSFTLTYATFNRCEIYLRKFGNPEFNLTVELRTDHPEGPVLDTLVFLTSEIPSSWQWFNIDFNDQTIPSDTNLFIVCPPAPSGVTTSFGYEWGYAFGDQYDGGAFWFTRDGGALWRDLPTSYEFTFKTYGS